MEMAHIMKTVSDRMHRLSADSHKTLKSYLARTNSDDDRRGYDKDALPILQSILRERSGVDLQSFDSRMYHLVDEDGLPYGRATKQVSKLKKNIAGFTKESYFTFGWNRHLRKAVKMLDDYFLSLNLKSLHPISDEDYADLLPKKNTNAGFTAIENPNGLSKHRSKGENIKGISDRVANAEEHGRKFGNFEIPMVVFTRTQGKIKEAEDELMLYPTRCAMKTRAVIGVDQTVICIERKFQKPVQDALSCARWYSGGDSTERTGIKIMTGRVEHQYFVSTDESAFDQNQDAGLIKLAFSIIEKAFHYDPDFDKEVWDAMVNSYIYKVFIVPEEWHLPGQEGILLPVKRGTPSGSMWTQIIDSLINRLVILTYMIARGYDVENTEMFIMGDDNLMFYNGKPLDLKDMEGYLRENFHLEMNAEKSSSGSTKDSPEYLSRRWDVDGIWRAPGEILSHLLYSERPRLDLKTHKHIPFEYVLYCYWAEYGKVMNFLFDLGKFYSLYPNLEGRLSEEDRDWVESTVSWMLAQKQFH